MTKNLKTRIVSMIFALAMILTIMPPVTANAAAVDYLGSLGIVDVKTNVYKEQSCSTYQGYLYANETFTILDRYSNGVWFIRYSMSSGPKTGYIHAVDFPEYWTMTYETTTGLAIPKGHTDVYYGNSSTEYVRAGYVDQDEYVVLLSEYEDWVYIEYDTTAGRKRGYVPYSSLTILDGGPLHNGDFYLMTPLFPGTTRYMSGKYDVYSGPNTVYTKIGSVSDMNLTVILDVSYFNSNASYSTYYIKYDVDGTSQKKSGFIFVPR